LQPLLSPPEWNEVLSRLSALNPRKTPAIMVCGPKSSGKSTFTKMLSNRLLSTATEGMTTNFHNQSGVALLDLDPGQPEFSIPGQLSLIHIQEPNFGPPYSHPIPGIKSRLVRAHTIGAVSPSIDPSLYMACALDLFAHYRNLLSLVPNCPLVINTPGWILGTGLEILVDLIAKVRPTEVLYMSQNGPPEVIERLKDAAKTIPLRTLPSQASEFTSRTAAHLRTMQFMSYFHLDNAGKSDLAWSGVPLTSMPPWVIRYSGEGAGILGIMCYGEQPLANLLADSINGSLVAVVVIDDMAAIPGWETEARESADYDEESESVGDQPYDVAIDAEIRAFDTNSLRTQNLQRPLIVRTPFEHLPYFNPANAISLDPRYSYCVGLALVRGIDAAHRRLQVLTSIPLSVIEEVNNAGKAIVLVSGKFDTPGWAYTEEFVQSSVMEKTSKKEENGDMGIDEEDAEDSDGGEEVKDMPGIRRSLGEGFQNAPWIEMLEGSEGRGVGSRVWRVRRDLGKTGDDGE
jgi:polynucleotide 5'-hydroxyl-kinase GRC3/NOL9